MLADDADVVAAGDRVAEALPHDEEVSARADRNRRGSLEARGFGGHSQLVAQTGGARIEALGEHVGRVVRGAALPSDHEAAARIGCDGRPLLVARRVGVDLEVVAQRHGARIEVPRDHACAASVLGWTVGALTAPHDHEATAAIAGDPGTALIARRVGVHLELAADRRTRAVVALAEDARAAPVSSLVRVVRARARPDHHEISCRPRCHRGCSLKSGRGGVRTLLSAPPRAGSREALHEDARRRAARVGVGGATCPRDDEVSRRSDGKRRIHLRLRREGVHDELRAGRRAGSVVAARGDSLLRAVGPRLSVVAALPHDDEATRRVCGDVCLLLVGGGVGVHLELAAHRNHVRTDMPVHQPEEQSARDGEGHGTHATSCVPHRPHVATTGASCAR